MVDENNTQANSIFVIRFYRFFMDTEPYWWGRIEHVQSSKERNFTHLEDMLSFIRSFDIVIEAENSEETDGSIS